MVRLQVGRASKGPHGGRTASNLRKIVQHRRQQVRLRRRREVLQHGRRPKHLRGRHESWTRLRVRLERRHDGTRLQIELHGPEKIYRLHV